MCDLFALERSIEPRCDPWLLGTVTFVVVVVVVEVVVVVVVVVVV